MSESIPQKAVTRTADRLLGEVYTGLGVVPRTACRALFLAVVRTGRTLVRDIARTMYDGSVCMKGLQEKVSGWLERYDFLSAAAQWFWREGVPLVSRDTFIALDSSDISKEFGGGGMEGMEMGYDASRGVTAMGHNVLCAAVVTRRRAMPLCMRLLRGRHGLPDAETRLYDELLDAVGDNGIPVEDRGFDSEENVAHVCRSGHRTVIRVNRLDRDVFGTGRTIDAEMADAPGREVRLSSPTRKAESTVRWRIGHFPCGESHRPVLVVSSTFDGTALYLYAVNFVPEEAKAAELATAAALAANAYFNRWSVEVFFQDVKQCFHVEDARVRTFRRLENLLALCTLAYAYFAHVLPNCSEESARLMKCMKENLGEIVSAFRPYVANIRELLDIDRPRFISGRPRKKPPDDALQPHLPGL